MADEIYHKLTSNHLWRAGIDLLGGAITALLCTSGYVADTSITGDEYLSIIPTLSKVGSALLTGCTMTDGVFDAFDTPILTPIAGKVITQIILYQAGSPAPLIRRIDTATGLGMTTDGSTITIVWPNGANKIFYTHNA